MTTTTLEILAEINREVIAKERLCLCSEKKCFYAANIEGETKCCYGLRGEECYALHRTEELVERINHEEKIKHQEHVYNHFTVEKIH